MAKRKTLAGFKGATKEIEVDVPDDEPAIWDADEKLKVVGTDVPRLDGMAKASGAAVYTADAKAPGMLHGRMLRAEAAGGTLRSLDLSAVESAPGVKYVRAVAGEGTAITHEGRDLAFVVADTEANLEAALSLAKVGMEPGPVATTVEDAAADGAPRVNRDRPSNVVGGRNEGQVRAFAAAGEAIGKADVVLERTYRTQVQVHTPLETHGIMVVPAADGTLMVYASTQGTFSVLDGLAGGLRMKRGEIEVVSEYVGGGFGCKFGPSAPGSGFGVEAARAALKLNAPVRAMLTRREEHLLGGNRPSSVQKVKLGVKKDGTVVGYTVESRGSAGFSEGGGGAANPMIYDLGKTAKEELTVMTHAGPGAAFRAPGHPQGSFALESAMDEAADAIGMDPLEFRMGIDRNPIRQAEYRQGAERFGWKKARSVAPGAGKGPVKRGVGMGSCIWYQGGGPGHAVDVTVHRDGKVEVSNGAQDIGTGTRTVLAVIVAEVLGLKPEEIQVNLGRTRWPSGPGSGGSQTAPTLGPCARSAAEKAREAVLGTAKAGDRSKWKAACARMEGEKQVFTGTRPKSYQQFNGQVAGVQFAEVEVDCETGVVRVTRVLALQDCGRVIDRLTAESQVIGAVIQGISYALFEDRVLDRKTGRLLHGDLEGYRIAGSKDVPDIEAVMFDVANAGNNVGMMGLGEPPAVPTAGAIANAVAHATGARVRELPITPARVLAALAAKGREVAMKPFAYARPKTHEELFAVLQERMGVQKGNIPPVLIKGGGIDLLDLAKNGVSSSETLVDIGGLPGFRTIGTEPDGQMVIGRRTPGPLLSVGAGVTLAQLASSDEILEKAPALAEAAGMAATPQIRNIATIVGNILQRPRCAYFRDPFFDCLKRGGTTCPAMEGDHSEGAIFGNGKCCSVHPSNIAVALMAVDAELERLEWGEDAKTGARSESLNATSSFSTNFFRGPEQDPSRENQLHPGEVIRRVLVPYCPASAYVEVDQKQSFDWASASAAVALEMEGGKVKSARVALGAVAPVPLLSEAAAKALVGKVPDEAAAKAAGEAAVQGATPLRDNGHKVQHLKICVQRAVLKAAARGR